MILWNIKDYNIKESFMRKKTKQRLTETLHNWTSCSNCLFHLHSWSSFLSYEQTPRRKMEPGGSSELSPQQQKQLQQAFQTNGSDWRLGLSFPESQLCSHPSQSLTPHTSAHHELDDLRQLSQLKEEVGALIACAAPFHCLKEMDKGKEHLAFHYFNMKYWAVKIVSECCTLPYT